MKKLTIAASAATVGLLAVVFLLFVHQQLKFDEGKPKLYNIEPAGFTSDVQLTALASQVMRDEGYSIDQMIMSEVARNKEQPNQAFISWMKKNGGSYTVVMSVENSGKVRCNVARGK